MGEQNTIDPAPDTSHAEPDRPSQPSLFPGFSEPVPLSEEIEEGRAPAILAYLPFGCFIALVRYRHNAFAVRHGKQGLFLTFCEMLAGLFLIPRLSEYFWITIVFASLASTVTGVYYALQGRDWTIPIIGKWFDEHLKI